MELSTSLSYSLGHLSLDDDSYLDMELCTPNNPVKPDADFDSESSSTRNFASSSGFLPYLTHYKSQFSKSSAGDHFEASAKELQEVSAFEDTVCEEIYRGLRHRESKIFHDYINDFGSIVLEQRDKMVQWIVEQSLERNLQYEKTFLAVNLFDQFMAKGSFEERRDYEVLGIACLVLATKIEETQDENRFVWEDKFRVGESVFVKPEIIGMEWLVQKVLNFHCYTPTIYNFLSLHLKAVNADSMLWKTATNLALLSLLDHETLSYSPSVVAAGLVILAFRISDQKSSNFECIMNIAKRKPHCLQSLGNRLRKRNWKELIDADERSYDW